MTVPHSPTMTRSQSRAVARSQRGSDLPADGPSEGPLETIWGIPRARVPREEEEEKIGYGAVPGLDEESNAVTANDLGAVKDYLGSQISELREMFKEMLKRDQGNLPAQAVDRPPPSSFMREEDQMSQSK